VTKNFPYLTHPCVLLALLLTFANDHYFKYAFPGVLTGKISDFSGLFYFPLFMCGTLEFLRAPGRVHSGLSKNNLIVSILVMDALFLLLKFTALREHFESLFTRHLFTIQIAADTTDLLALSVNVLTYKFAEKYFILSESE
jgi:hypothetical protein